MEDSVTHFERFISGINYKKQMRTSVPLEARARKPDRQLLCLEEVNMATGG